MKRNKVIYKCGKCPAVVTGAPSRDQLLLGKHLNPVTGKTCNHRWFDRQPPAADAEGTVRR